jgi:hypothetical protein
MVQIVSKQSRRDKRVSKEGSDLFAQGTAQFNPDDSSSAHHHPAHAIQLCQPLLMDHMYHVRASTLRDLERFCASHRADLATTMATGDPIAVSHARQSAQKYQTAILHHLTEMQQVFSHTAQYFLWSLITGAKTGTSQLFIALNNDRQLHYEKQTTLPEQRPPTALREADDPPSG